MCEVVGGPPLHPAAASTGRIVVVQAWVGGELRVGTRACVSRGCRESRESRGSRGSPGVVESWSHGVVESWSRGVVESWSRGVVGHGGKRGTSSASFAVSFSVSFSRKSLMITW
jgi:hypothetical protein